MIYKNEMLNNNNALEMLWRSYAIVQEILVLQFEENSY